MNVDAVIAELSEKYPGKKIISKIDDISAEIICELEPTEAHPEYSEIIAVIDKSVPHMHERATETYTVIHGELTVYQDGTPTTLKEGESLTIHPGCVHYAEGNETWITCRAEPGWTVEDHMVQECR